jgi:hypothetical protein
MKFHVGPANDVLGRVKPVIAASALNPRGIASFFTSRGMGVEADGVISAHFTVPASL